MSTKPQAGPAPAPVSSVSGAATPAQRASMLLPFALFLIILPFPGTVAARLLFLAICFGIAVWQWWRVPGARATIPCKPVLGAWIAVCLASLGYAFDFGYTLRELQNELGYTMMAFFAFFVIARERSHVLWLLRACGLGVVIIGTWAILGLVANDFLWREGGGHGGIGVFATYVITIIPGLAWLACDDSTPLLRRTAVGLSFFTLLLAAITMQRAIWPVLALQLIVVLVMAQRAGLVAIKRRVLLVVIGAVAVATLAGIIASHQIRYRDTSGDVRLTYWPNVIAKIAEHPLTGTGFGRGVIHNAYPELTPKDATALWHAHNVLLNYGLEMGVPGMLSLAALFAGLGIFFWGAGTGSAAVTGMAGVAIVAGVLLRNQFNDFFIRDMSLLFWALTGLFARLALAAKREAG